jgi:hypothetical protein
MTSFDVDSCRIEQSKLSEVLVNNLFLFWRFNDHGHHYQEKINIERNHTKIK